ncbi:DUF1178 family protein [Roseobacter sp. HKCCA0434]|uniref:DUF1178 family protein n=1 Tax=Roseobacter sp. HKCCA0434 TaxID=3079297 RepID=UPI002905A881|nr:DUF1178 family protein [Roseobacter sp. HKCCA0434]
MIKYALRCAAGHDFESWFPDGETYERLRAGGHLSCAICGEGKVEKALMAPRVGKADAPLSGQKTPAEQALAALRKKVESESDYVGKDFAAEARRIHEGESDKRSIWGEARAQDAKKLVEDGIPVVPLPFGPRKVN